MPAKNSSMILIRNTISLTGMSDRLQKSVIKCEQSRYSLGPMMLGVALQHGILTACGMSMGRRAYGCGPSRMVPEFSGFVYPIVFQRKNVILTYLH